MATKEELQEKEESCQSTEDYANLSKEVFKDLSDKEWANSLIDEGADWAETADDFVHLASAAAEVLEDKTQIDYYLGQGKDYCMNLEELMNLANSAFEIGGADSAKDIYAAAQGKCTKTSDFIELSKKIQENLGDAELARQTADKALEKPFSLNILLDAADELLDRPTPVAAATANGR